MWLALTAALLGSVGICFCYVPYVVALPIGIYAAWLGSRALATATDENGRSMATAGLVSGIISSLVNAMFAVFFLFYAFMFVAYIGIVIVAIAAGASEA